jgi:16S rRNA processing protein RimM
MSEINNYVYIARIVSPHGLYGEVKVKVITDNPERFTKGFIIYLIKDDKITSSRIVNVKPQGNFAIVKLNTINDITEAEKFREYFLGIKKDKLAKLEEGKYYHFEIIGLAVYSVEGDYIGNVVEIFSTGGNDVYTVKDKDKEVFIPALKDIVEKIDLVNKRMIVRHQPGLF